MLESPHDLTVRVARGLVPRSGDGPTADAASPRHKRIRLDAEAYGDTGAICSVTIATRSRLPALANPRLAAAAVAVIRERSRSSAVAVHAYCVMPDHLHLILTPSGSCDVVTFVAEVKNLVQREAWRLGMAGRLWQVSFWDHFLRRDESLSAAVQYVLENPVRKGLAEEWSEYPYCGMLAAE